MRRSLEPAPFPGRRDVELAFAAENDAQEIVFFDHFFLDERHLWAAAVQLSRGGLDGALAAAGQRQLLRALAAESGDPDLVIDGVRQYGGNCVAALASARIDVSTGELRQATLGSGRCSDAQVLAPGDIFWLAIAGEPPTGAERLPLDGLQSLVDQHFGRPRSVLAAIHFKAWAKQQNGATFSIRNDQAAVPDALKSVGEYLARQAVANEDASALELALDEILTNQINYGFRDGSAHEMLVDIRIDRDRLTVEIRDDGVPFDPLGIAAPDLEAGIEERQIGGLGMHFVKALLDEVSYRRSRGWNVLTLGKTLAPRSAGVADA
ncbi:MAG TPA: ATP-binding protein [Rhizobiaceae bacterium]|nr:ATP-binding protein [Rhizobiaceae bacterium]